jgi:hypothetical protein
VNIASTSAVQVAAAGASQQGPTADAVQILVLKKALDAQAVAAATLLQSLPTAPALATGGSLGTRLNAYA